MSAEVLVPPTHPQTARGSAHQLSPLLQLAQVAGPILEPIELPFTLTIVKRSTMTRSTLEMMMILLSLFTLHNIRSHAFPYR